MSRIKSTSSNPLTVSKLIATVWRDRQGVFDKPRDLAVTGELKVGRYDSQLTDPEKRENRIWVPGGWLYYSLRERIESTAGGYTIGTATITGQAERQTIVDGLPVVMRNIRSYRFERTLESFSGKVLHEMAEDKVPLYDKREFGVVSEDWGHVVLRWDD